MFEATKKDVYDGMANFPVELWFEFDVQPQCALGFITLRDRNGETHSVRELDVGLVQEQHDDFDSQRPLSPFVY